MYYKCMPRHHSKIKSHFTLAVKISFIDSCKEKLGKNYIAPKVLFLIINI